LINDLGLHSERDAPLVPAKPSHRSKQQTWLQFIGNKSDKPYLKSILAISVQMFQGSPDKFVGEILASYLPKFA
jgi:hypothetical protein